MVKKLEHKEPDVTDVTAKPAATTVDPLAGLADEAAKLEGAAVAEGAAADRKQEQQEVDTLQKDLADTLAIVATMVQPALWWLSSEQFAALWGKQVQANIAAPGAEIMRRHGLGMGDLMTKYGPYVALAGALGPSAMATVHAFKQEKQRQIAMQQQGAADGAST